MDRRAYLATVGCVGVASIAGCSMGGTDDQDDVEHEDEGPPYFEQVDISGPETLSVGESSTVTVSVANTGGSTGNFTASLQTGPTTRSVEITDIEPGEIKSTELGPFVATEQRTVTLRLPDHAVRHDIQVEPAELELGEELELAERAVTVSDVELRESLLIENDSETRLRQAGDGRLIGLINITSRSIGGEAQYPLSADAFTFKPAADDEFEESVELPDNYPQYGPAYEDLPPGNKIEGWTTTPVAQSDANQSVVVLDYAQEGIDARWDASSVGAPNLQIVERRLPDEVEKYTEWSIEYVVRNEGDADEPFHAILATESGFSQEQITDQTMTIPANEEQTVVVEVDAPPKSESIPSERQYTLTHTNGTQQFTPAFVPKRLPVGDIWMTHDGMEISINDIRFESSVTIKSWDNEWIEIGEGERYALAEIEAQNQSDDGYAVPNTDNIFLVNNETGAVQSFDYPNWGIGGLGEEFRGSHQGTFINSEAELEPGESIQGYVAWDAPDIPADEAAIGLGWADHFSDTIDVVWDDTT